MRRTFAGAIARLGIAGVAAACTLAPSTTPTPSPTPSPSPSASQLGAPPTDGLPAAAFAIWTRFDLPIAPPRTFGGNRIFDLVRFDGRLLAVGGVFPGCCDGSFDPQTRALVWHSDDGSAWTLDPATPALALGHIRAVATDGHGLVAVGSVQRPVAGSTGEAESIGSAWASSDGTTWDIARTATILEDVTASAGGFVASGEGDGGSQIWRSADGRAWTMVAGPEALGPGQIQRIAGTDSGFIAVGESGGNAAIWRSSDGTAWRRVADQASLRGGRIRDVAGSGDGFVAVGANLDRDVGQVWTSADGESWDLVDDAGWGAGSGDLLHVIATPGAYLVVGGARGADRPRLAAWASADGQAWRPVAAQPALVGMDIELAAWLAGAVDGSVVGVGNRWDVDLGEPVPVAWTIR